MQAANVQKQQEHRGAMLPPSPALGIERSASGHRCYAYQHACERRDSDDGAVFRDLARVLLTADCPIHYFPEHDGAHTDQADMLVMLGEYLLAHVYAGQTRGTDDVPALIGSAVRDWCEAIALDYASAAIDTGRLWRAFAAGVNASALVRLSPYYFALKHMAAGVPSGLPAKLRIQFGPDEMPAVGGVIGACQQLFAQVMARVAESPTLYEFWFDAAARVPHRDDPAARWNEWSVMRQIAESGAQSTQDQRRRMDRQGRISPSASVQLATCAEDAEKCGVLLIENFLDVALCERLCRTFSELEAFRYRDAAIDPYWNNRALWFADVKRNLPQAARLMLAAQRGAMNRVSDFYRLSAPLFPDMLQLLQWPEGLYMAPHADNAHWNGSAHLTPYRDFAGIFYLNDDFAGGEIYLTRHNLLVKPRPGMLLAFTGGFYHEHGVTRIERGNRITMPFFMTFAADKQDLTLG